MKAEGSQTAGTQKLLVGYWASSSLENHCKAVNKGKLHIKARYHIK